MLVVAVGTCIGGCKPQNQYRPPPPPDVAVQLPVRRDVTRYIGQTGQLAAVKTVSLVARIQGTLEGIDYQDGVFVSKGANRFTIEPPFKAELD